MTPLRPGQFTKLSDVIGRSGRWGFAFLLSVLVTGCSSPAPSTPATPLRPFRISIITAGLSQGDKELYAAFVSRARDLHIEVNEKVSESISTSISSTEAGPATGLFIQWAPNPFGDV